MKKKMIIIVILIIIIITGGMFAFNSLKKVKNIDSLKFKEEYEGLNGKTNSSGKIHRTITISEENPFKYVTAEEIVQKIEERETFYVYFGSKLCPWCRSVIEKTIDVAKDKNIETIYYVDIWDDDGNEILRDKYILENGVPELSIKGTEAYYQLLKYLDNVLDDYYLTDDENNSISINEKRIYAPYFIYVENGVALKLTEATSSKQTDSRGELTEEILKDEEELLKNFFDN